MPSVRARRAVTTQARLGGLAQMFERMQPRGIESIDRQRDVEFSVW